MDYSRQELIWEIGKSGQKKIMESSVAIVGVGGIGCASASLLVRSGVRKLVLIDRDVIDESNLQRQILFANSDIGKPKSIVAKEALERIGSNTKLVAEVADLDMHNVHLLDQDVVLDCTDNLETRFLINEFCRKNRIPFVYSAAIKNEASVFPVVPSGPCLRCLFGDSSVSNDTCELSGVTAPSVVFSASLQVSEAIKVLLGKVKVPVMARVDLWNNIYETFSVKKNPSCPVCRGIYDYLSGKKGNRLFKVCGREMFQFRGIKPKMDLLKKRKGIKDFGSCLCMGDVTVFDDGRALVKARSLSEARSKYSKIMG